MGYPRTFSSSDIFPGGWTEAWQLTGTNPCVWIEDTDSNKGTIIGSASGVLYLEYISGGSDIGTICKFTGGGGLQMGAPTGGDKGAGTINVATNIYKNNSAYANPDYVLEHWATGKIVKFANNEGAASYEGRIPLDELADYLKKTMRLPGIDDEPSGIFDRTDILLARLEEAYTYIAELHERVKRLETGTT